MRITTGIIFASLFFAIAVKGQLAKQVFPLSREFKQSSWYVSPLGTISVGSSIDGTLRDTSLTYSYKTQGETKLSYGLEVGWFHTFKNYQVGDWFEGGIAYRRFTGEAAHTGLLTVGNSTSEINSRNAFTAQFITVTFRAVDIVNLKPNTFLTWGIGANFNYLFSSQNTRENDYPNGFETFQNRSSVQAHLQVGYGLRLTKKILLTPTIEVPFLTAYPTDNLNPSFSFFGVNYQPIIVGLRLFFLREDPENCNAPRLIAPPAG